MEAKCKFCNTPIREHKAGRCLDVMVYKLKEQSDFFLHKDWEKQVKKGGLIGFANYNKHGDGWENIYTEEIPHFSTDLNHAIELLRNFVSKHDHKGVDYSIQTAFDRLDSNEWYLVKLRQRSCNDLYAAGGVSCHKGETLALAFCRAFIILDLIEKMKEENNG